MFTGSYSNIFEFPPIFEKSRKRVIKSPKIYFSDFRLVAYLIGIQTLSQAIMQS